MNIPQVAVLYSVRSAGKRNHLVAQNLFKAFCVNRHIRSAEVHSVEIPQKLHLSFQARQTTNVYVDFLHGHIFLFRLCNDLYFPSVSVSALFLWLCD